MSVLSQLTLPLRRAFSVVFRRQVSLTVAKGTVRVVLKDESAPPGQHRPPTRAELNARKEQQEFTLVRQQLAELLDDLPETRSTMRHLVFVERALERKGLRALHRLPVDVLQKALDQLEGLVINWSPVGLAALRSKMAVAIIDRDNQVSPTEAEADAYRTAAVLDTMPSDDFEGGLEVRSDDDALAAAYAALGDLAPGAVELQGELGSSSARAVSRAVSRGVSREALRGADAPAADIRLRELQG